ncbi:MAG: hypothetical protein E7052_10890 [Lentisphaerae bacterium]|nr:hypothetical protein [Lentisphaerota bacterium]
MAGESFEYTCPHCAGKITGLKEWIGLETDCPHCAQSVIIKEDDAALEDNPPVAAAKPVIVLQAAAPAQDSAVKPAAPAAAVADQPGLGASIIGLAVSLKNLAGNKIRQAKQGMAQQEQMPYARPGMPGNGNMPQCGNFPPANAMPMNQSPQSPNGMPMNQPPQMPGAMPMNQPPQMAGAMPMNQPPQMPGAMPMNQPPQMAGAMPMNQPPQMPGAMPPMPQTAPMTNMTGQAPYMSAPMPGMTGQMPPMSAPMAGMTGQMPPMSAPMAGMTGQMPPMSAPMPMNMPVNNSMLAYVPRNDEDDDKVIFICRYCGYSAALRDTMANQEYTCPACHAKSVVSPYKNRVCLSCRQMTPREYDVCACCGSTLPGAVDPATFEMQHQFWCKTVKFTLIFPIVAMILAFIASYENSDAAGIAAIVFAGLTGIAVIANAVFGYMIYFNCWRIAVRKSSFIPIVRIPRIFNAITALLSQLLLAQPNILIGVIAFMDDEALIECSFFGSYNRAGCSISILFYSGFSIE